MSIAHFFFHSISLQIYKVGHGFHVENISHGYIHTSMIGSQWTRLSARHVQSFEIRHRCKASSNQRAFMSCLVQTAFAWAQVLAETRINSFVYRAKIITSSY